MGVVLCSKCGTRKFGKFDVLRDCPALNIHTYIHPCMHAYIHTYIYIYTFNGCNILKKMIDQVSIGE